MLKSQPSGHYPSIKPGPAAKRGRCPSWRRVYGAASSSSGGVCSKAEPAPTAPPEHGPASQCRRNPKVANMAKVAFLGLGVVGFPMAGHLVKKGGHEVTGFNRTSAKALAWAAKFGGKTAPTPKAAAPGPDFRWGAAGDGNSPTAIT